MKVAAPKSICARVTLIATAVTALVLAGILVATSFAMNALMRDASLGVLRSDLQEAYEEASEGDYKEAVENVDSSLVQIVGPNGEVIACSSRLRHLSSLADVVGVSESYEVDSLATYESDPSPWLAQGAPYLLAETTATCEGKTVTIVALMSIRSGQETVQGALRLLVIVFAFAVVFVAALTWVLAKRTLRPVEQMRNEVAEIQGGDFSARLDVPEGDPDLARLARTFNELLARLELSVDEQKQFVSDASHELKSPVAATALMLEILREHPEATDLDAALGDLQAENARMQSLVDDMLVLARSDENRIRVAPVPSDVMDLVADEARVVASRARHLRVDANGLEPVTCRTDPELLRHALRNLLENAARYAHGTISVSCTRNGDTVVIEVADDGPGIAEQDRERVFGRFVRLEDSRSREKGSTGLGLAVVRSVVERLGGRVYFDEPRERGARAVIELANC